MLKQCMVHTVHINTSECNSNTRIKTHANQSVTYFILFSASHHHYQQLFAVDTSRTSTRFVHLSLAATSTLATGRWFGGSKLWTLIKIFT